MQNCLISWSSSSCNQGCALNLIEHFIFVLLRNWNLWRVIHLCIGKTIQLFLEAQSPIYYFISNEQHTIYVFIVKSFLHNWELTSCLLKCLGTYEVATTCVLAVEADKLICIVDGQIHDEQGRLARFMSVEDADLLIRKRAKQSEIAAKYVSKLWVKKMIVVQAILWQTGAVLLGMGMVYSRGTRQHFRTVLGLTAGMGYGLAGRDLLLEVKIGWVDRWLPFRVGCCSICVQSKLIKPLTTTGQRPLNVLCSFSCYDFEILPVPFFVYLWSQWEISICATEGCLFSNIEPLRYNTFLLQILSNCTCKCSFFNEPL